MEVLGNKHKVEVSFDKGQEETLDEETTLGKNTDGETIKLIVTKSPEDEIVRLKILVV